MCLIIVISIDEYSLLKLWKSHHVKERKKVLDRPPDPDRDWNWTDSYLTYKTYFQSVKQKYAQKFVGALAEKAARLMLTL